MKPSDEVSEAIVKGFTRKCDEQECYVNKMMVDKDRCVMCKRSRMNKMTGGTNTDNFLTVLQKNGY